MASEQFEEYLEAIGRLEERGERVTTSSLAKERQVSAPSATEMLGRLSEQGLVSRKPRGEVVLTEKGREMARSVMRRHRLWERFLHDVLGFRWDRVHGEACKLEHATSPEMEQKLARAVADNTTCPHGHEIPSTGSRLSSTVAIPLSDMPPSQVGQIASVREENPALLREMERLGLKPGVTVEMAAVKPDGDTVLRIGGRDRPVPAEVASGISVIPHVPQDATQPVPLADLTPGEAGEIYRLTAGRTFVSRCLALGFTPGTRVTMVQNPGSGPLIVLVRDTRVALGRGEALKILVVKRNPTDGPHDGSG